MAAPAVNTALAPPSARIVGPYALERRLGVGGMGEVWLGRHVRTRGVAAVKLIQAEKLDSQLLGVLFERERRAIARMCHPHIVSWHELGPDFLATTYVRGSDLAARVHEPMPLRAALKITLQVASALAHAHGRGVVHRDVKPSNILLDEEGNAYLTDFGIAFLADEPSNSKSPSSSGAGTPSYMAPEQAKGEGVGPASDQYALARTLIAMLIGKKPPRDRDEARALLPSYVPASLIEALMRATQQDPSARYPTIDAFSEALESVDLDEPPPALLECLRPPEACAWARGAISKEFIGPDIMRCTFKLSDLARRGLISPEAYDAFHKNSGYRDFAWSAYGRSGRLGRLDSPEAYARAAQIVILVHGFGCDNEVWRAIGMAVSRDRSDVIVLAPDVHGFGDSHMSEPVAPEHATQRSLLATLFRWREILGLADVPTLVVGHSMGAATVLALRDDELPPNAHRVAISPVFPGLSLRIRLFLWFGALVSILFARFDSIRKAIARATIANSPDTAMYTDHERQIMFEGMMKIPPGVFASISRGYARSGSAPGDQLQGCTLVVVDGDPVAREAEVLEVARKIGYPASRVRKLVGGMHLPQAEHREHPEWTGRNINEIGDTLREMLGRMRGEEPAAIEAPVVAESAADSSARTVKVGAPHEIARADASGDASGGVTQVPEDWGNRPVTAVVQPGGADAEAPTDTPAEVISAVRTRGP